jgi:hypothetical protein
MVNMKGNCEFNNLRCKESNCLYHNRSFVYDNKFRNFMTATHPCSRVSVHRTIVQCAVLQGSSTFQIVRATLTISMMPAGHKAMTYMYT